MKERCVRESVKGGVCERHTETEKRHWHPVYRKIVSIQPASLATSPGGSLSASLAGAPPNTLSPSPLFGGEKNPVAIEEKGSKRKVGSVSPALAFLPCKLTSFGAPGPTPGTPAPDLGTAAAAKPRRGAATPG